MNTPQKLLAKEIEKNPQLRTVREMYGQFVGKLLIQQIKRYQASIRREQFDPLMQEIEEDADIMTLAHWYYDLVDKGDYDTMLRLFSANIVYTRGGVEIPGKSDLASFYRDRKLSILHQTYIQFLLKKDGKKQVYVWGGYAGTNSEKTPISGSFFDIFDYNSIQQVQQRRTLFAQEIKPDTEIKIENKEPFFQRTIGPVIFSFYEATTNREGKPVGAILIDAGDSKWLYVDGGGEDVK